MKRQDNFSAMILEMNCEIDNFEPVYYDEYIEGEGWTYQVVPVVYASHVRHKITGKIYAARANQRRWMREHDLKVRMALRT